MITMRTEAEREYQRRWYSNNKERAREYTRRHRANNPEANRWYAIKFKYGLTREGWRDLYDKQGGCCAICGQERKLNVDHDHSCCPTNEKTCGLCVRGLLCDMCNRALGMLDEDPTVINSMLTYVRKYTTKEEGRQ